LFFIPLEMDELTLDLADWNFALALLNNANKRKIIKLSHPLVRRVEPVLLRSGFVKENESLLVLPPDLVISDQTKNEIQKQIDTLINPEAISFAQVAEILKRNGTLPGIRLDIDDSPLGQTISSTDVCELPPKPWQISQ